jgi:hypothetical protein
MNLKILTLLVLYWTIVGAFFYFGASYLTDFESTGDINEMGGGNRTGEQVEGGLFSSGVNLGRFFALMTFGIGLPDDTPSWFSIIFMLWQTFITIFTIGFLVDSIWSG